jgi:uncharacterized membrane protein YeaQ/YmgE (transglycosylase-associated protein family)
MGVALWIALIGLVAGTIARLIMPGPNRPHGFLLTIVLGIAVVIEDNTNAAHGNKGRGGQWRR